MIALFLRIIIYVILVVGHHRLSFVIGDKGHHDIELATEKLGGIRRGGEFHAENNTQNQLKKINGKFYFTQTFKPITMGFKHQKLVDLKYDTFLESPECRTPNNDSGHCVLVENCTVLNNIKYKDINKQFLKDSICRVDGNEVRYCCGKYENYKYLLPKRPLPKSCGYEQINFLKKGKIFGGTEARLGEFPWLARIIHTSNEGDKSVGCEGFLIHKRFILTAAHCVRSPRIALVGNITEIQLGEHNTQTEEDCNGLKCADPLQTMRVKSIIPHPEYRHNSRNHHYDIALIYLKGEAKFSDYVQPVCLLEKPNTPQKYWISGWGKTEKGNYSDVKMKVSIPPFDITECNKIYSKVRVNVGQSQFCAGGEKGKDSCVGDSGGPLMQQNDEGRWFAVGVVSYGISCGLEGWPGVYTSIPFYYDWIVEEIIKLREPELLTNINTHKQATESSIIRNSII
ncbi:phenoloxidase-activating factor 1-like [Coccinella septempunctata]|uniref:phenoloxidase-activating factor 1-like n=1 Tax=Coccinella septempunctata TaxID=41139 RepID=UPI001D08379E|nr:phenoloxidase-activating factor 1-like [Coccinella septempunctata]